VTDEAHDLTTLLALEPHGPDVYVGISAPTPWGRVYGGQVVAQGLRAAAATVEPTHEVHSVRAYFIRGGEQGEPIRFEVDRIRNGRSFVTRRVVARQSSGAILNLDASFQRAEDRADVQVRPAPIDEVPGPDDVPSLTWGPLHDRRIVLADRDAGRLVAWQRVLGPLKDDPVTAACALAFASDDVPLAAARTTHPVPPTHGRPNPAIAMSASLDHAVWFHRPFAADEWLLYDLRSQGWTGGRGLAFGEVFRADGTHVASVAQEGLVREVEPGA
jgi:acyl-CoA thioesterase-2